MRIQPKSQEQIDLEGLIEPGVYDFELIKAEDKVSKKGNEMIKATLKVFHGDTSSLVDDYLMEAMMGKLLHFCNEVGLSDLYQAGELHAADCVGKCGKVKIVVEPEKTIEQDGESKTFAAKNSVKDYGEGKRANTDAKGPKLNSPPKNIIEDDADDLNSPIPF